MNLKVLSVLSINSSKLRIAQIFCLLSPHWLMQCCVVPYRMWLEGSRLHDVMYEVVAFPEDWLQGKIKVRGPRTELAAPVRISHDDVY